MKRITTFSALALLVGGLVATPPAFATPSEPVPLVSGPGVYADLLALAGASSAGVVYGRIHLDAGANWREPELFGKTTAGDPVSLGDITGEPSLAATMLTFFTDQGSISYRDMSGVTTGTLTPTEGQTYLGAAPVGWLVAADDPEDSSGHVYSVNATTQEIIDLGSPPGLNEGHQIDHTAADASGAVLSYADSDGNRRAAYVAFSTPGTFVPLNIGDTQTMVKCTSIIAGAAACLEQDFDAEVATALIRSPLDGTTPTRIARTGGFAGAALTATHTGWIGGADGKFTSVPVAGGTPTVSTLKVSEIGSTGTQFVVTAGGPQNRAELRTVASAGATPAVLVASEMSPAAAQALTLGAGRVAWSDDTEEDLPVWSKTLSRGEDGLTTSASSLVAPRSTGYGMSLSGRRTAFFSPDPTGPQNPPNAMLNVATGSTVATISKDAGFAESLYTPDVSGTRVLFRAGSNWRLYDIAAGTTSTPSWLQSARSADLWGNYVAYTNADGSVWRKDLTSSSAATQLSAALTGDLIFSGGTFASGDFVAWRVASCVGDFDCTYHQAYRNARTMADATVIGAENSLVSLGSDGAVLAHPTADTQDDPEALTFVVRNVATAEDTAITGAEDSAGQVVTDSGVAAWLTHSAIPMVTALTSTVSNPPRYLGNAISKVTRPSYAAISWTGEMVTSAAMTSCSVVVKSGSTVLRTLTCDQAKAAQGDALVSWDGKDGANKLVAPGNYTWTLSASNGDGPVLNANGTATAVTGAIAVPAVKPVVTGHPVARTVASGKVATFSAAANGAPAPTVQWQASTNGGKTWGNMSGKKATTLSFTATRAHNKYRFRAVFTNSAGSVTTAQALLTVR